MRAFTRVRLALEHIHDKLGIDRGLSGGSSNQTASLDDLGGDVDSVAFLALASL